jgi:hypothetical protein
MTEIALVAEPCITVPVTQNDSNAGVPFTVFDVVLLIPAKVTLVIGSIPLVKVGEQYAGQTHTFFMKIRIKVIDL